MSKGILKQLYNGEIYPAEEIYPRSQRYRQLNQEIDKYEQLLEQYLNVSNYELFQNYCTAKIESDLILQESTFEKGFRLGVQIILEAINRDIPISGDISIFVYPEKKQEADQDVND